MDNEIIYMAITALAMLAFGVAAISPWFVTHEACQPKADDHCPFCENEVVDRNCDCDDMKGALDCRGCDDCGIIYTGASCPRCQGMGREVMR